MKRLLLITGALLAFTASSAFAAGVIHLSQTDCGAAGTSTITNTCTNNTGVIILIGSAVSPQASTQIIGVESIVDVGQTVAMTPWWRTDAAGCRNGKITSDFNFVSGPFTCMDLFAGQALGGQGVYYPDLSTSVNQNNCTRFDIYCAVDATTPLTIDNATEMYLFHMTISKVGTIGPCTGCSQPTSLTLNNVEFTQEPGLPLFSATGDGNGQSMSYNGGSIVTPTKSTSWGAVKALYR